MDIEKGDKNHEGNDDESTTCLDEFEDANIHRLSADRLDECEGDVATVEHGNGEHIEHREVDIEDDAEPESHTDAFGIGEHIVVGVHHHYWATHVLNTDARFARDHRVDRIDDAHHSRAQLFDGAWMDEGISSPA